ncbi:MAG: hypothetical protein QOJ17_1176 [Rhodospirillaceae bacterium]|jgi:hypothetical protein|nr:hypothetical protein [Rhodospirillaceae bacterium]
MKSTLIALALVAVAGAAGAQTATPPSATPPSVSGATVTPPAVSSGTVTTPAANPPRMSTPGVNAPSAVAPNTANAPALPNAPGSNGAAKRIQADGYKNVQGLTRGTDGKWHGTAMRGSTLVGVVVDGRGNVSTQ